ncbi:MAG: NepR family anti-sigma factor [Rubricella sp.]
MAQKKTISRRDRQIDENLKRVFSEKLDEDLPDRFKDLIAQLKAQDPGTSRDEGQ